VAEKASYLPLAQWLTSVPNAACGPWCLLSATKIECKTQLKVIKCLLFSYFKVSFHSRSQGSQASQQACVCVLIWKHGWDSLCEVRGGCAIFAVKSHMFNFCEHPRNSWGCCEVWKQKSQVRNAPSFWRYSFGLTLLCERYQSLTCTITESSRNTSRY